jgi:tetratricopeptide (TPR) repeat protein
LEEAARSESGDDLERARAAGSYRNHAALALHRDPAVALASLRKAVVLDPTDAVAHALIGSREIALGDFASATQSLTKALKLGEEQNHLSVIAAALTGLASLARTGGDLEAAASRLARAKRMATRFVDLASVYVGLGNLEMQRGNFPEAVDNYRVALSFGVILGDKDIEALANANMGFVAFFTGRIQTAKESLDRAWQLYEELGDRMGMARVHGGLGALRQSQDDDVGAEQHFRRGLALEEELKNALGIAARNGDLGIIHAMRGEFDEAEARFKKAVAYFEQVKHLEGIANQYGNLGRLEHNRGRLELAAEWYEKSLDIERSLGRLHGMMSDYTNLATLFQQQGQIARAREAVDKALALAKTIGDGGAIQELSTALDRLGSG